MLKQYEGQSQWRRVYKSQAHNEVCPEDGVTLWGSHWRDGQVRAISSESLEASHVCTPYI